MEYELVLNSDEPKKFELLRLQTLRDIYAMEDKDPLAEHFDMFKFFKFLAYDTFLQEPPQILVLQVTLAMGMLGSIVSLTWSFIRSGLDCDAPAFPAHALRRDDERLHHPCAREGWADHHHVGQCQR